MGKCGGDEAPLENVLPLSGRGTMVITVDNPPNVMFHERDGSTQARMLLALGASSFGNFARVAQGDGMSIEGMVTGSERVVLEFAIPELFKPEGNQLKISITPTGVLAPSSVSTVFSYFDDRITIECLTGCGAPAQGRQPTLLVLTGFQLFSDVSLFDQVIAMFGNLEAISLEFGQGTHDAQCADKTCIILTQPECRDCIFERGSFTLDVSVVMKADQTVGARTSFTYWAAPVIVSATMNTVGTAVNVLFDQNTNRAMMNTSNSICHHIVSQDTLATLATLARDASCVWESSDSLNIFLGTGASIAPGHELVIALDALKSSNSLSQASVATQLVKGPAFPVPPSISIQGTSMIDGCSELELRAVVDSPRPLRFRWSCRNDDTLSAALSKSTGAVLFLSEGTQEMTVQNKIYEIVVTARDFLGATSNLLVYPVFKTSSPAPKLTFFPSRLSVYRDETVMVKVVAEFSKCLDKAGALVFDWGLESRSFLRAPGSNFASAESVFEVTGSQLFVPAGVLDADTTYKLAVNAHVAKDINSVCWHFLFGSQKARS